MLTKFWAQYPENQFFLLFVESEISVSLHIEKNFEFILYGFTCSLLFFWYQDYLARFVPFLAGFPFQILSTSFKSSKNQSKLRKDLFNIVPRSFSQRKDRMTLYFDSSLRCRVSISGGFGFKAPGFQLYICKRPKGNKPFRHLVSSKCKHF